MKGVVVIYKPYKERFSLDTVSSSALLCEFVPVESLVWGGDEWVGVELPSTEQCSLILLKLWVELQPSYKECSQVF